jgi:DNA-binding transcriptional MerR regulator
MSYMNLSTGQLSGIARVSYMALYRYVKDFSEFFSDTAKQHKRGRRWNVSDLQIVQAIRYLQHERTPKAEIRRLLADGWRPPANSAYSVESLTRLIEATLLSSEESVNMVCEVEEAVKDIKLFKSQSSQTAVDIAEIKMQIMNIRRDVRYLYTQIDNVKKQRRSIF